VVGEAGGVAFTVLSLDDISAGLAPDSALVTVDQTACRYVPHVTAVATGVEVRFTNSDRGAIHNVHAYYGYDEDDNWFNATTPFGIATSRVVQRAGVARLTCDAGHFWMLGYLLAFPHPYFAVTDAQGRFEIRGVPPGTYTLRAWHEGITIARREGTGRRHFAPPLEARRAVTVSAGGSAEVAFTLRADGFAP
jgi:plastocyanin